MIESTQVQEFVAETRESDALMITKKNRRYQRGSLGLSNNGELWYGRYYPVPGEPQKSILLGRTAD